jgi:hypothetical protein
MHGGQLAEVLHPAWSSNSASARASALDASKLAAFSFAQEPTAIAIHRPQQTTTLLRRAISNPSGRRLTHLPEETDNGAKRENREPQMARRRARLG